MNGQGETHECPFCGAAVGVVIVPALTAFELHLDGHMAAGDQLLRTFATAS